MYTHKSLLINAYVKKWVDSKESINAYVEKWVDSTMSINACVNACVKKMSWCQSIMVRTIMNNKVSTVVGEILKYLVQAMKNGVMYTWTSYA